MNHESIFELLIRLRFNKFQLLDIINSAYASDLFKEVAREVLTIINKEDWP